jgi:hypothetical protein
MAGRIPQPSMVARFNGRISEVVKQTRFTSAAELKPTLNAYCKTYNQQILQRSLNHLTPSQALNDWSSKRPEPFVKRVTNLPELDRH